MITTHRRLLAPAAATALCGLLATSPSAQARPSTDDRAASTTTVTDERDTAGPLDVRRVTVTARETDAGGAVLRFTARMDQSFDARALHRRHRTVVIELDTDGQPGSERNITVYAADGDLRADLISNATREVIRPLHVRQLDDRTLRVRGNREQVGARKLFWVTTFHRLGSACGWQDGYPVHCQDVVPERGWIHLTRAAWPGQR